MASSPESASTWNSCDALPPMLPVSARTARKRRLHAREDPRVRVVHGLVALLERRVVEVERIGVLHRELARAHDAEARPDLVAELGLDLVEIDRQLPVALQLAARDVGDHFLVRRAVAVRAVVAVASCAAAPARTGPSGPIPATARPAARVGISSSNAPARFISSRTIRLDLAQHAQADRQPAVQAGGQAADQAGAQHELVAHDLRIGGHVAQGVDRDRSKGAFRGPGCKKTSVC